MVLIRKNCNIKVYYNRTNTHKNNNENIEKEARDIKQILDNSLPDSWDYLVPPTLEGVGFIGNGVQVSEIRRQFDQFLMDRVRVHTSSNEDYEVFLDRAQRVDDLIADPDAGLSAALQIFFNAVQDVADDPETHRTHQEHTETI